MKIGPPKKIFGGSKRPFLERKFTLRRLWTDGRCTETTRNSGKTKTTGITTISRLPSHTSLAQFGSGEFDLQRLIKFHHYGFINVGLRPKNRQKMVIFGIHLPLRENSGSPYKNLNIHCVLKKTCDHIFDDKLEQNCPFIKIFGTLTTKCIGHRQVYLVSHLTYFVQLIYLGKLSRPKYHEFSLKLLTF